MKRIPLTPKDIKAAEYNPRVISDEAKIGLSKSIDKFGDLSGITWNKKTKRLVTGHQRWTDLTSKYKDLQFKHISPDRVEISSKSKGPLGFYVRIVDWDRATEKAANVTANNTYISGYFDTEALQAVMADIKLNLEEFEFNSLQFDKMMDGGWISDITVVDKTEENLDGIFSKITIICKPEDKEALIEKLKVFVKKLSIKEVSLDC